MMNFKSEMKKYHSLSNEDKLKKVINLLKIIKDKDKGINETYELLTTSKNLPIAMIDDIYQVLLEVMIYQQWLNQKKSNKKINEINNKLHNYLAQEKLEREREARESEELLNF